MTTSLIGLSRFWNDLMFYSTIQTCRSWCKPRIQLDVSPVYDSSELVYVHVDFMDCVVYDVFMITSERETMNEKLVDRDGQDMSEQLISILPKFISGLTVSRVRRSGVTGTLEHNGLHFEWLLFLSSEETRQSHGLQIRFCEDTLSFSKINYRTISTVNDIIGIFLTCWLMLEDVPSSKFVTPGYLQDAFHYELSWNDSEKYEWMPVASSRPKNAYNQMSVRSYLPEIHFSELLNWGFLAQDECLYGQ